MDVDWVGSTVDRKSTSGLYFSSGSAMISWSSKKQTFVAISTTKADYIVDCSTVVNMCGFESYFLVCLIRCWNQVL